MAVPRRRRRRPRPSTGRTTPPGDWRISSHGYITRQRVTDGVRKTEYQHRTNMEEWLGRKLLPGETVHHKNGNKADNRVGPDGNLELWVTAQPAGQRPADLVKYAREILARYGNLDLRDSEGLL